MPFQEDWILRQVEALVQFVSRLLFQKDRVSYTIEDEDHLNETDLVYIKLNQLIKAGRFGQGEDLLFANYRTGDDYLALALDFYQGLNALSSKELEAGDFSREEIEEGLRAFLKKSQINTLEDFQHFS